MESRELSLFLKRKTLKPEAAVGGDITRRFTMNKVGRMVAAAQQDRTIRLYDAQQCNEIQRMQDDVLCTSIAFSPKGDIIATGSVGRVVKLWDIRHGTPIATLEGHTYPVLALAFSPDGLRLVSGSGDTSLIIWDIDNLKQIAQLKGHSLYVVSCDWDPRGNRIVSSSVDASICEWDATTGELLKRHEEHRTAVQVVRFSRDGKRLASGSADNTIVLWDASDTMKPEATLRGHTDEVRALSFSYDGKYLASGSADKELFVWSLDTNTIEGESSAPSEIDGIEWYPDIYEFITSDGTGAITRWEVTQLEAILAPFNDLLSEIESDSELNRREELIIKFEDLRAQHTEETLRDKRLFYVNWQCKKALGLLKGPVKRTR